MKRIALIGLLFVASMTHAQDSLRLSVSQAMELGLKNRFDLKANQYSVDLAENSLQGRKDAWLPEINGAGNVRLNTQIQQAYIPAGFAGLREPMLVKFGATSIAVFGLDLNQTIFNPLVNKDIALANTQVELQKEKWRQDEHAIKERIAQAYLNVLLRELQTRIAKDNETRFADYYRIAEGKLQNGAMIENEVLKAKLDLDNAQIETQKSIQNLSISRLQLNYQLNIEASSPVALTDKLETLQLTNGLMSTDQILANRSELRQLVLQKKSAELSYQRSKIGAVPTLSFFANYSQQYMNMNFNLTQGEWWTPFSYVGLRLNVPISAYYKNKTDISSNVVRMKQIDLQIEQRKSDVRFQSESSMMELTNATRNKLQAEENYKLSQRIYATQKSHYAQGSLQYQSLLDTEKSLSMAEQNYIRSIYDLMVAQINYQRAIGEY